MDGSGADPDRSGQDGTQAPPPPPVFPDPLAGLVTGERLYRPPGAAAPVEPPPAAAARQPAPRSVPARRSAPGPQAARSAWSAQVAGSGRAARPPQASAGAARSPRGSAAREAGPARVRRQAAASPARPPAPRVPGQQPTKGRSGLIGCLVGLAVLAGLLFNVLREIIEAVVDLLR
ncbi:hypothetical protein ACFXGA_00125 [Actinosynnema sp. NPDC059335]|uniref:hypothetical protein n=1 Tax=Actinosynnema sp. NPDC059335 TaxID=3346804 RepID=UPI00366BB940